MACHDEGLPIRDPEPRAMESHERLDRRDDGEGFHLSQVCCETISDGHSLVLPTSFDHLSRLFEPMRRDMLIGVARVQIGETVDHPVRDTPPANPTATGAATAATLPPTSAAAVAAPLCLQL